MLAFRDCDRRCAQSDGSRYRARDEKSRQDPGDEPTTCYIVRILMTWGAFFHLLDDAVQDTWIGERIERYCERKANGSEETRLLNNSLKGGGWNRHGGGPSALLQGDGLRLPSMQVHRSRLSLHSRCLLPPHCPVTFCTPPLHYCSIITLGSPLSLFSRLVCPHDQRMAVDIDAWLLTIPVFLR